MKFLLDPEPYSDPWALPLPERFRMLTRRRRRVAYFYEQPNNSTFRYRAYNMVQVLEALGGEADVSASYFFLADRERFEELAASADVLVICRSRYSNELRRLVALFRARRKRVLFDIDDLVFDPAQIPLVVKTLGLDTTDERCWDDWFAMASRMGATLRECDGSITTNDLLASHLEACSGRPAAVVPNFLNREQIRISDRVYAARAAGGTVQEGQVLLGYFSGSPSHRLDFAIIEDALAAVMQADPRLRLAVVGYIDAGPALQALRDRIDRIPFQDYVNLQRVIGSVDINLMPLQSNPFTDCKSELKFFDAAAVGTLSVASPSYTYARCMEHGRTGFLAHDHAWERVLTQAIEAVRGPTPIIAAAHEVAMRHFRWDGQLGAILAALGLDR